MIELRGVHKEYRQGTRIVLALGGVDVTVERGEFVAVTGPSGSGKSTLLHLMAGLDLPSRGEVLLDGRATSAMTDDELTEMRRTKVGLVFQFFNLIPTLNVLENTALPRLVGGERLAKVRGEVEEVLSKVGLADRLTHVPEELSGGEMQRVAIARSLVCNPEVLLADEPTGNLDSASGAQILEMLSEVSRSRTVIMVTHDPAAAAAAARHLRIADGRIA